MRNIFFHASDLSNFEYNKNQKSIKMFKIFIQKRISQVCFTLFYISVITFILLSEAYDLINVNNYTFGKRWGRFRINIYFFITTSICLY